MSIRFSTLQNYEMFKSSSQSSWQRSAKSMLRLGDGHKYETYAQGAKDTTSLLAAAGEKERDTFFLDSDKRLLNVVRTYQDTIQKCNRLLTDFYVLCKTTNNAALNSTTIFPNRLEQLESDFIATLNTRDHNGNYLFSGVQTDQQPVDMTGYPTYSLDAQIPDPAHPGGFIDNPNFIKKHQYFGYYKGSDQTLDVQLEDDLAPLDFRVKADNPAFEKILRAFQGAKLVELGPPQNGEHLGVIEDIIVEALSDLNDGILATLGQAERRVDDVIGQLIQSVEESTNTFGDLAGEDFLKAVEEYQLSKVGYEISLQIVMQFLESQKKAIESFRM